MSHFQWQDRFYGIPWISSWHRNSPTPSSMEFQSHWCHSSGKTAISKSMELYAISYEFPWIWSCRRIGSLWWVWNSETQISKWFRGIICDFQFFVISDTNGSMKCHGIWFATKYLLFQEVLSNYWCHRHREIPIQWISIKFFLWNFMEPLVSSVLQVFNLDRMISNFHEFWVSQF